MKTIFGKILVVMTFVASVMFMVTAVNLYFGSMNWTEKSLEMKGYSIQPVDSSEGLRYQAMNNETNAEVGGLETQPKAIISALNDKTAKLRSRNQELTRKIQDIKARTTEYEEMIATDTEGLNKKIQMLQADIESTLAATRDLSTQLVTLTTEANETLMTAQKRREDITRFHSQLDEIRTEEYRLQEQKEKLVDLLTRYKEIARALKRRQEQLTQSVGTVAEAN